MLSERENFSIIPETDAQILADVGIYVRGFDIAGNQFRAYYDANKNLIFVVDGTISARKPNVMLVINSTDGRKWDEILIADWDIDLEVIRPKRDNKYQKLDIEYDGLTRYAALINAYDVGENVDVAVDSLIAWRDNAVRRAAVERLNVAEDTATRANETIDKSNDALAELQERLGLLRDKLHKYRMDVGREPTKQSAAKILRAESQIDTVSEKISRTKKRLANARRRLAGAENDIQDAQQLIDLLGADTSHNDSGVVMVAPVHDVAVTNAPAVPMNIPTNTDLIEKPKAEKMAEDEVKPLFDKDPEFLDDEIAFKPIDFGAGQADAAGNNETPITGQINENERNAPAPLSFTPPVASSNDFEPIMDVSSVQSVLDSMRPVTNVADEPQEQANVDYSVRPGGVAENNNYVDGVSMPDAFAYAAAQAPVVQNSYDAGIVGAGANLQPGTPVENVASTVPTAPVAGTTGFAPVAGVATAPVASDFRPVSPIRGNKIESVDVGTPSRSKLLYYVLLILLIVLSIFALWQYQKSTIDNTPDLATTVSAASPKAEQEQPSISADSPFIGAKKADKATKPVATNTGRTIGTTEKSVTQPADEVPVVTEPVGGVVGNELDVEIFAKPLPEPTETVVVTGNVGANGADEIGVEPLPSVDVVDVVPVAPVESSDEEIVVDSPFIAPEPVVEKTVPVVVDKPEYNVSQNDKMFVAGPDYETDTEYYNQESVVAEPEPEPVAEISECSDGSLPDANGCCTGEVFTDMEDGTFACCQPVEGGECFAPMM